MAKKEVVSLTSNNRERMNDAIRVLSDAIETATRLLDGIKFETEKEIPEVWEAAKPTANLTASVIPAAPLSNLALPDSGYVRQKELLPLLPFSSTTLWRKINSGDFPKPVKLGERITAWKVSDVHAWANKNA